MNTAEYECTALFIVSHWNLIIMVCGMLHSTINIEIRNAFKSHLFSNSKFLAISNGRHFSNEHGNKNERKTPSMLLN